MNDKLEEALLLVASLSQAIVLAKLARTMAWDNDAKVFEENIRQMDAELLAIQSLVTGDIAEAVELLKLRIKVLEAELKANGAQPATLCPGDELKISIRLINEIPESIETKRSALVTIAARQKDPGLGANLSIRRHWWDQLSKLSNTQVDAIDMLGDNFLPSSLGSVAFTVCQEKSIQPQDLVEKRRPPLSPVSPSWNFQRAKHSHWTRFFSNSAR